MLSWIYSKSPMIRGQGFLMIRAQLIYLSIGLDILANKSIPQRSYVGRHHEMRAKKNNRARITGVFGATATGRKFKANLTYVQWL